MSQVCSNWRRIVVSTPSYWSAIHLFPNHFHNPENATHLANVLIRRSANLPLSLRFSVVVQNGAGQENPMDNMVVHKIVRQFIILCDFRVRSLICTMGESDALKLFEKRSFPILDNINVTIVADPNFDYSDMSPFKFTVFQAAPILRKAALRFLVLLHPIDLRLPWGQLTKLHLGCSPTTVDSFIWMMGTSQCLEDAFFHITFNTSSNAPRQRSLRKTVMPNLQLLHLKLIQPSKDRNVFELFHLPVLEELWLERGEVGMRRNMGIYRKLVSASRVTLKRIILNEFTLSKPVQSSPPHLQRRLVYQAIDRLLQFSQNITALHLATGVCLNPTTLEQLSTGNLLPMLDTLELSTLSGWDIVSMVERRNTTCKLGISSSTSHGPQFCAFAYLYLTVVAHDIETHSLEVAVAALDLEFYTLHFA